MCVSVNVHLVLRYESESERESRCSFQAIRAVYISLRTGAPAETRTHFPPGAALPEARCEE